LGFSDGSLLFGYTNGVKRRGKARDGSRRIRWDCGGPFGQCWRQSLLLPSHHTVFITEGETDCLSVISLGIELAGEVLAVALASASSLPRPEPFTARNVILVPDRDKAGEGCVQKLSRVLGPVVESIKVADLTLQEGVTCG
jgi:5S rRNA maturation endonuclease (ribonuclease M5)